MRRLYRLFLYLSSFTRSFLLAASPSIAQCNLDNLNPSYCEDDPAFALTGGTNYWVNNTATSTFDPSALGTGTHLVVTTDGTALSYYVNTSGTFSPEAPVSPTNVPLMDDNQSTAINICFTCNFFGIDYTQLKIGSNGVIGLGGAPGV